jgi:hypothetical protein
MYFRPADIVGANRKDASKGSKEPKAVLLRLREAYLLKYLIGKPQQFVIMLGTQKSLEEISSFGPFPVPGFKTSTALLCRYWRSPA